MRPLTEPCDACAGNGIVPHVKRKLEDGITDDPADCKLHNLCEKCGGSGVMLLDKARIKEPGNVADMDPLT